MIQPTINLRDYLPESSFSNSQLAALLLEQLSFKSPTELIKQLCTHQNAEQLLKHPNDVFQLLKPDSAALFKAYINHSENSELLQCLSKTALRLQDLNANVIEFGSNNYPRLLAQISSPPPVLYTKGDTTALHLPNLAIVGGRNCSEQGTQNARAFAKHLATNGFVITSGLALGIDSAAHLGAMDGLGKTIAVMATGIDQIYPASNRALAEQIINRGGCLITEFPLGAKPLRSSFPKRNRIISGLSLGTLVVEAKIQSGSLITANTALKQNREVFAIPGSIHNPLAKGCHQLIKQGAKLVESSQDIIDELSGLLAEKHQELIELQQLNGNDPAPQLPLTPEQKLLLNTIGFESISIDLLAEKTQIPVEQLLVEILNLELDGLISHIDGRVERIIK